jgi:hypothetical protein
MNPYQFSTCALSSRLIEMGRAALDHNLLTESGAMAVELVATAIRNMEQHYPKTVYAWRVVAVGVCDLERELAIVDQLTRAGAPGWDHIPWDVEQSSGIEMIRLGLQLDAAEQEAFSRGFRFRFDFNQSQVFIAPAGSIPLAWVPVIRRSDESHRDATFRTMVQVQLSSFFDHDKVPNADTSDEVQLNLL